MSGPKLCLRWNNHHPNFISGFKNLLEDEDLVDVTLSVDGQKIKAHKVILSACSPYFKEIFSVNPCKHPVVILSGVKFIDLKTIIEFMYCGEINITDEQLPDLLEVAEALQVRGLFKPNQKREAQDRVGKKKKKEASLENMPSQSDVSEQNDVGLGLSEPSPRDYINENTSSSVGSPSVMEWVMDQANENEFDSCEYTGPLFDPPLTAEQRYLNNINTTFRSDQSADDSPPSPTDQPATSSGYPRRRNNKVQQTTNFHLALEAVRTGKLGFCKASKLYGVNNRTLWLEYKKRGYPTVRSQPLGLKLKQASSC